MLNSLLPCPKDFYNNELKTIKFLKDNKTVETHFPELSRGADNSFYKLKSLLKTPYSFGFESYLKDVIFLNKIYKIYFGGIVNLNNSNSYNDISYYLCICGHNDDDKYIVRKYHFDYTNPTNKRRSPHPIFHLQYPGKLSNYLNSNELKNDHMNSWLSEPRIFFTPMSLALLLNLIFKEFHDPADGNLYKIREDSHWRSIVIENENLFLKPYYESCYNFLDRRYRNVANCDKIFTTDYYYAE